MFTGLVVERGIVAEAPQPSGQGGKRLVIAHSAELGARLDLGASLAVSGVCLTITARDGERSTVELAPETLARTNLDRLAAGSAVNLEPALRMGDALGGHWVQGHVDSWVEVIERRDLTEHRWLTFALPESQAPYLVEKGSVTLDGVSLTVAAVGEGDFSVTLIPHTLEVTTLGECVVGSRLNLEVDVLAKYIERALQVRGVGS
ncbi:MAG: riboflavin synthase [Acidobacteriota bacterium]